MKPSERAEQLGRDLVPALKLKLHQQEVERQCRESLWRSQERRNSAPKPSLGDRLYRLAWWLWPIVAALIVAALITFIAWLWVTA